MDNVLLWIAVFDSFLWYFVASCWLQTTASLFREHLRLYTYGAPKVPYRSRVASQCITPVQDRHFGITIYVAFKLS